MKKITLLILFLISLTGYSQIVLQEGFEGTTLPNYGTNTWELGSGTWGVFDNGVGMAQNWTVNTQVTTPPTVCQGARVAFINRENIGAGNTSQDFLATPAVTVPTDGELRFLTRTTINGPQGTTYKIMVAPATSAQDDPAAYTLIQQWPDDEIVDVFNVCEEVVVDLSAFAGQSIYIAFVMEYLQTSDALNGDRWLVDQVRVVQKCLAPTVLGANLITQTSASLFWTNNGPATQWEIEIIPATGTPTGDGIIVSSIPYVATATQPGGVPLAPSTSYSFYVRAICDGDVGSAWSGPFTFTTSSPGLSCAAPIVIPPGAPYSDSSNTANYGDNTDVPQPASCAGTATNYMGGNEVFYSYTPTETGAISITMLPSGNNSGIFVYAGCSNVGVSCVAGVANTGGGIREIPSLNVTAGQEYIIVISSTAATQTFSYTLTVQTLNCAPPTDLSALGTGETGGVYTAELSWANPSNSTSWEYVVQPVGGSIPTGPGQTTTTNVDVEVSTITGTSTNLALGQYQYWVRADCGDGTFSPWSGPYIFNTTSCDVGCNYQFVMTDTWGDGWNGNTMNVIQNGVTIATIGSTFTTGVGPVTVTVPLCNGPFELFWNAGGAFANEVGVSVVNSFGQTIYVKAPGSGTQNSLLFSGLVDCENPLCLPPTNLTVTNVTTFGATLSWTPNGPAPLSWDIYAVPVGSPAPTAATTPTANTTSNPYVISGLLADTTYTYYVRAVCEGAGANPWSAASPNFTTLPTCPKPTALTVTLIGQTSAQFGWTAGGTETAWEVIALPAGSPAPTAATTGWTAAPTNPFVLGGLTAGTAYDFYVRAVCTPTDSSTWAGPLPFNTTICEPVDQCTWTFVMTDSWGDGWNGNTMSIQQNGITIATIGSTFTTGVGPISVPVQLCTGVPVTLFWNAGGAFANEVGISVVNSFNQTLFTHAPGNNQQNSALYTTTVDCVNPQCLPPTNLAVTNVTTFGATLSWTPNGPAPVSWDVYAVPVGSPAPTAATPPTANTTNNPFTISGLTPDTEYVFYVRAVCAGAGENPWSVVGPEFTTLPTCPKPTNLSVSLITQTSAQFAWTAGSSETAWEVIALPAGSPAPTAATTGWTAAPTNPFVLEGLSAGTPYDFYIRAVCTPTDSSTWAGPLAFNTTICDPSNQCLYTFTMVDSFGDSWNGNTMSVQQNGITVATLTGPTNDDNQNPVTQTVALCNGVPFSLVWNTGGAFANEVGVSITSFLGEQLFTHAPGAGAQGTTLYTGTAMCIPPTCPQPTALNVIGLESNFATVGWTEMGTATQWAVVVQPQSAPMPANGDGVIVNGSAQYTTPTALEPGFYEFYVQAICSDSDSSFWSGPFAFFISAQNVVCAEVEIVIETSTPGVIELCPGESCLDLTATYTDSFDTTDYQVQSIPFIPPFPFTGGTEVSVNIDDVWSAPINLPFNFCFFGTNYTTLNVGSNGVITFTPQAANAYCPWPFTQTIPNTAFPIRNAVYGVYQDINPATSTAPLIHNINYQILGAAPCRTFVVNFYQVAQFSCGTSVGLQTSQIVLYETSNIVDVYVQDRTSCTTWNSGNGVIGIQNAAGTQAHVPPGRNTGQWEAHNEAWRFLPDGDSNVEFTWLKDGQFYSNEPTINVCVSANTLMTAQAVYTGCGGTQTTTTEEVQLQINEIELDPIENVSVCDSYTLPVLTEGNYYTGPGGTGMMLNAGEIITESQTVYVYATQGTTNICSDEVQFNITVGSLDVVTPGDQTVCEGYMLPALTVGNYFTGPGGTGQQLNAGDEINESQTLYVYAVDGACIGDEQFVLTILETPDVAPMANVNACESYMLPALTVGNYFTGENGTGTQLNAGDVITTSQTIYVYADNGTCSDQEALVIEIGTFDIIAQEDVTVCDSFELPALTLGNYYTQTGGVGLLNAGDLITSTQTIYVYASDGVCSDEDSFVVTVNLTPVLPTFTNVSACQCYTLPALANGTYYTGPGGTGTQLNAGETICTDQTTVYIYAQTGTTPNCTAETSFVVTIGVLDIIAQEDVTVCDSFVLPALTQGAYFTQTGGVGPLNVGDSITSTQTIYVYFNDGTCTDEDSFVVTVNQTPVIPSVSNVTACGTYVLPALTVGNYFDAPGGAGNPMNAGDVISVDQTTVYIYAQTGTTPNCVSEASYVVTLVATPDVTDVADVTACDSYTLPVITGQGSYFTGENGTGTQLNPTDVLTSSQTVYIYAQSGAGANTCSDQESFQVTIGQTPEFTIAGGCQGSNYVLEVVPTNGFDTNGVTYQWTAGAGTVIVGSDSGQSVVVQGVGTYSLSVTSNGCTSSEGTFTTVNTTCTIQKGISANGDGQNDYFDLEGQDVSKLQIFNRYGVSVYSRDDYSNQWYGQSDKGEELPDGTYYYVIDRNSGETKTGWIYINREQ